MRVDFFLLTALLLLFSVSFAHAQDYRFEVPRADMDVFVQPDSSVRIAYDMDFKNSENAHAIDIVDVGMPIEEYNKSNMSAGIDGIQKSDIRDSQYVHPGVEVHLGSNQIRAGQSGNFKFEASFNDLVFQDTTNPELASFQITPTWFGDQYVLGTTQLTIRVHLPAGLKPDEVLYQDIPFTGKELIDNSVVISWQAERRFTSEYRVGVSFPKRVMSKVVVITTWDLFKQWYKANAALIGMGCLAISVVLAIITFMRFTGGTGGCLIIPLLFIVFFVGMVSITMPGAPILLVLGLIMLLVIVEKVRRRRRAKYLPAMVSVEGGGIKRGLTAPEAALLLELSPNQVITLILFGMLKKGLIRQFEKKPVAFVVEEKPPADVVIQPYEKLFLQKLRKEQGKNKEAQIADMDFGDDLKAVGESVVAKMKGFNVDETKEYYKQIISRAWLEAKEIGDVDAWQKRMDEKVDWLMLDPQFPILFRPYQDMYVPRSYRTSTWNAGSSIPQSKSSGGSTAGAPRFSDVAGSVAGWMQNTAGAVVAKVEGPKGLLDLSSLDKAMASSGSGGHSGGGGGCACACAGCACACACAGGGR